MSLLGRITVIELGDSHCTQNSHIEFGELGIARDIDVSVLLKCDSSVHAGTVLFKRNNLRDCI